MIETLLLEQIAVHPEALQRKKLLEEKMQEIREKLGLFFSYGCIMKLDSQSIDFFL